MRSFPWIIVFLWCLAAQAADEVRTWTDASGRTMRAQFIREVDGDVTFLKDGKLVTLPLDQLREQDQKLIRELESNKKIDEAPPPAGAPRPELTPLPSDNSQSIVAPGNDARPGLTTKRAVAETRNWRDSKGKQTQAKFVRIHEGNVILSRAGRSISIPFSSLSRQDQEYIREFLTARGEANLVPALSADDAPLPSAESAAPAPVDPQAAAPADSSPFSATDNEAPASGGGSIHQKMRERGGIGPIAASDEPEPKPLTPGEQQAGDHAPEMTRPAGEMPAATPPPTQEGASERRPGIYTTSLTIIISIIVLITCMVRLFAYINR